MAAGLGGGGSAYVRLQKPEDGIGQAMQYWGGIQEKRNEAAQEAKAKAAALKAEQDKAAFERYNIDPKEFETKDAGYQDLNADNINYANESVKISTDYMRQAQEAYMKGDRAGAEQFRNKALANNARFKARMGTMESAKKNFETMQKLGAEGKLSGYNKGSENFYKATTMGGTIRTIPRENGEDLIRTTYTDKDGEHVQYVSSTDINSGAFGNILKQDIDGDIKKIATSLKGTERKGVSGATLTTRLLWDNTVETSARQGLKPMLNSNSYMADMVDQLDLYDEMKIDRNNPPAVPHFTDEQRKMVENELVKRVKGQFEQKIYNTPNEGALNRAHQEKMEALRRANKPKTKADEKKEMLSKLYYDTKQAINKGDYSILLGNVVDANKNVQTVTRVVESADGNYLIPITSEGEKLPAIVKSEDGILSYKLNSNPTAYKNITVPEVQSYKPTAYERASINASNVAALADNLFNEEGKRKSGKGDESILKALNDAGITGEDISDIDLSSWSWGDKIKINGKIVDTSNKANFQRDLESALNKPKTKVKAGTYQAESGGTMKKVQPTKQDRLGLGL